MSSNTNIGNTPVNQGYVQLIHMGETGGIDGTLRALYDGDGTASDLLIASDKVKISTELYIGSKTLTEFVQDTVGAMFSSNTETNITVTYQDGDGTIDLVSSGEVTLTGSETLTNKTLTSPVINTGISGSAILDSDTMSGASATKLSSSESIKAYVDTEVAGIVSSAPSTLDTLNELAAALGDDANFSTTVTNSIATKLPLAGGQMTGNITFSGSQTVDGRDVSADGSKLDGIEASATADQSNAEIRTAVEAATDSNVFTDADHSKLNAIEASADVTDTANVTSAGALMDSEVDADIKTLSLPASTTISATAKTLLDDANVGAMRTTLGLGTLAQKSEIDDIDQIAAGVKLVAGESFVDSDDNLMTAAAIDDRINSAAAVTSYTNTGDNRVLTSVGGTTINGEANLTFDGSTLNVSGTSRVTGNGGLFELVGTDHSYIEYFPDGISAGRKAYVGFGSSGNDTFTIANESSDADIFIKVNDGGVTTTALSIDASANARVKLPNDNQQLAIGAGQDLKLYHLNDTSIIYNNTGGLTIQNAGAGSMVIKNTSNNQDMFFNVVDDSVTKTAIRIDASDGVRVKLPNDNQKLSIGESNDLELYHNGNSIIKNTTGQLILMNSAQDQDMAFQVNDGGSIQSALRLRAADKAVRLPYDNQYLTIGDGDDLRMRHNGSNSFIENITGHFFFDSLGHGKKMQFATEDSSGTKEYVLNITGDNHRVGIGTTNPTADLDLVGTAYLRTAVFSDAFKPYSGTLATYGSSSSTDHYFVGDVGIGTNSPTQKLDIRDGQLTFTHSSLNQALSGRIRFNEYSNEDNISGAYIQYNGASNYLQMFTNTESTDYEFLRALRGSHLALQPNGGNVGIGTTSPNRLLHLQSTGDTIMQITSADGSGAFIDLGDVSDVDGGRIVYDSGSNLLFNTASTERLRINSSGNVGIGTASPSASLHINTTNDGSVFLTRDGGHSYSLEHDTSQLYLYNRTINKSVIEFEHSGPVVINEQGHSTVDLRVEGDTNPYLLFTDASADRVGIGTGSPSQKLHVAGNVMISNNTFFMGEDADGDDIGLLGIHSNNNVYIGPKDNAYAGGFMLYGAASNTSGHVWYSGNAEAMRIDSSGNVLIGGTSASGHGFNLEVLNDHAYVKGPDGWNGNGDKAIVALGSAVSNESFGCGYVYGTGLVLSTYKSSGGGHFGSSTQNSLIIADTTGKASFINDVVAFASSDKRLKENIKPLDDALDKINKINGVEFDWIDGKDEHGNSVHGNEGHDVGVIAQEIEEVLPEVVTTRNNGYKAVKYEKIVPLLIEAIKEQQKQIEELKNG